MRAFHWLVMLLQVGALVALTRQSEAWAQQLNLQQLREATCNGSTPRIVNEPSSVVVPGTQVDAERSRVTVATPPNATAAGADAAPPETPLRPSLPGEATEFQIYVENTVGHELPLFRNKFFTTAPTTFAPLASVAVPADYVVGPSDEIIVRAWGQIDIDYSAVVDRNGKIYISSLSDIRQIVGAAPR